MSEKYTGFKEVLVPKKVIDNIYNDGKAQVWDKKLLFHPNMYLELINEEDLKQTALVKVNYNREEVCRVFTSKNSQIKPRNKEQCFVMDALNDDSISIVVLTGITGSGKTILALSSAMDKIDQGVYQKVILTRPMSEVGKYKLGALPGRAEEKFNPYLLNYMTNLEQFVGKKNVNDLISQGKFEIIPLQLFRGASFTNALVLADEMQVCSYMEILTVGTRIGDHSKIIIMGDLNQRDEKIAKNKTGIYKLVNDQKIKDSPIAVTIELQRCERSKTAKLFADVFEEK